MASAAVSKKAKQSGASVSAEANTEHSSYSPNYSDAGVSISSVESNAGNAGCGNNTTSPPITSLDEHHLVLNCSEPGNEENSGTSSSTKHPSLSHCYFGFETNNNHSNDLIKSGIRSDLPTLSAVSQTLNPAPPPDSTGSKQTDGTPKLMRTNNRQMKQRIRFTFSDQEHLSKNAAEVNEPCTRFEDDSQQNLLTESNEQPVTVYGLRENDKFRKRQYAITKDDSPQNDSPAETTASEDDEWLESGSGSGSEDPAFSDDNDSDITVRNKVTSHHSKKENKRKKNRGESSQESHTNTSGNLVGSSEGPGSAFSDDDDSDTTAGNKVTSRQTKEENKRKRNRGESYTNTSGNMVRSRKRKPVHRCKKRKCHDVVTNEVGDAIFKEYWQQGNHDKRAAYISSRIEYSKIKRSRKRTYDYKRAKEVSWSYFLEVKGARHQVCKDTFLKTLDETDTFVRVCAAKKTQTLSGIAQEDRRGKRTPSHTLTPGVKENVRNFIRSFPAYKSHYSRKQTSQKYLSSTLNREIMWKQYNEANEKKISYSSFCRIFNKMGLKFKPPASDTCALFDELKMKIKISKTEEDRKNLESTHELHLRKAEAAYNLKRQYKTMATQDPSVKVLVFDLEQCLPTPDVASGTVYYLRQLYTYNLTVVDTSTGKTHCYMWHEGEAGRGANEIASCLYTHCMDQVDDKVETLYAFSDSCTGQNRNSIIASMFHTLLQAHESLKTVNHIFLVRGHTRMECDTKHSVIERERKKVEQINIPNDWYRLVHNAGKNQSFEVTEMKDYFFDFETLLNESGPLINRKKKEDGEIFYWTKTQWFQYSGRAPGIIKVKSSFNAEFQTYNMIRGLGKNKKLKGDFWHNIPSVVPVNSISEEKKKDILQMLGFIDPKYHDFYKNLQTDKSIAADLDPDLPSEEEEGEVD